MYTLYKTYINIIYLLIQKGLILRYCLMFKIQNIEALA